MYKVTFINSNTPKYFPDFNSILAQMGMLPEVDKVERVDTPRVHFEVNPEYNDTPISHLPYTDVLFIAFLLVKANHKIDAIRLLHYIPVLLYTGLKECKNMVDLMAMFETFQEFCDYKNSLDE